jgi:hypothetical protein
MTVKAGGHGQLEGLDVRATGHGLPHAFLFAET